MTPRLAFQIAAFFGFLAVALGAFGAHGLKPMLTTLGTTESFEIAVRYQFLHALAMLVVARLRPFPAGTWYCFAVGILVFSGSLYVLALTGVKWLGAITPIGGVAFLAGWLLLVIRAPRD
ncbi:hypothetical protein AYO41_00365 [Verrucomicrobia bacterium SCGC AG-212-E04]|nr:hypothetical protein AYO41_00365 [Verrucomicrobia bacterium SCGC AG-212-E04]